MNTKTYPPWRWVDWMVAVWVDRKVVAMDASMVE